MEKKKIRYLISTIVLIVLLFLMPNKRAALVTETNPTAAVTAVETRQSKAAEGGPESAVIAEDRTYTSKEEVALYLHTYGHLPDNYITKKQSEKAGWNSKAGNLSEVAPGKSIGGSHFGNYEGQLPERDGRKYYECDIDSDGGYRDAKRLIYSNDGLIFYTGDHYKTFEKLYGPEGE
ncbi:MAG: ribonuclease domain-containing protein [Hungatella sp.]